MCASVNDQYGTGSWSVYARKDTKHADIDKNNRPIVPQRFAGADRFMADN